MIVKLASTRNAAGELVLTIPATLETCIGAVSNAVWLASASGAGLTLHAVLPGDAEGMVTYLALAESNREAMEALARE